MLGKELPFFAALYRLCDENNLKPLAIIKPAKAHS